MSHNTLLHIPTPGDHYSPSSGSAVMTVIYELSRAHQAAGGATTLVVGRGTRHDYPVGTCVEVDFPKLPDRNRKILDVVAGRLGMTRPFISSVYRAAMPAISAAAPAVAAAHNAPSALACIKNADRSVRACLYCHNELFSTYSGSELTRAMRDADVVVCVSRFLAEQLQKRLGSADSRVFGINNGVDTMRFRPGDTPRDTDCPTVLFVGRVLPEKGPDLLLKAAQKLMNGKRRFTIRIVGSSNFSAADPITPYEQELRTLAGRMEGHVEFQPFVERSRILEEYARADIFCAPSNWDEPCSLTVPEAIACGLPTIASRRGGIPEVGGDAVLYFDPPNTDQLAERLESLIDDSGARADLGRRAREQALAISWEKQYELVYSALFG